MSKHWRLIILFIFLVFLVSCGRESPATTAAPATPATPVNTATAVPTSTTAPSPTPDLPQGSVEEVANLVDAHARSVGDWQPAMVDMLLYTGGEVWAQEASTALVSLVEKGLVRVAPNSIFTLQNPDADTLKINLSEGQMWLNIEGLQPGKEFEVETPAAVASVRGTRFSVRVEADGATTISCLQGSLAITSTTGSMITLTYKLQTTILPGEAPAPAQMITNTESIRWGMAAGPNLEVVAPVGKLLGSITLPGFISPSGWSWDGKLFSFHFYDPSYKDRPSQQMYYNLTTGAFFTPTEIPTTTSSIGYSPVTDALAWSDFKDGKPVLCSSTADGSNPVCFNPPENRYRFEEPRWSPDGQWLLFSLPDLYNELASNLYRSRPDGSEFTQLTFYEQGYTGHYTWSPDGAQIAYSYVISDDWQAPGVVWVMNQDGANPVQIFDGVPYGRSVVPLPWSPDGKWLALASTKGLFLVSPNGKTSQAVPETEPGDYYSVQWSPTEHGWPLLYSYSNKETYQGGDYFVTAETAIPQDIYLAGWGPVYSPDGKRAAFGMTVNIGTDTEQKYLSTIYFYEVLRLWK